MEPIAAGRQLNNYSEILRIQLDWVERKIGVPMEQTVGVDLMIQFGDGCPFYIRFIWRLHHNVSISRLNSC